MELNQVTSVTEIFSKFMPHINMSEALKYEITNDEQSKFNNHMFLVSILYIL